MLNLGLGLGSGSTILSSYPVQSMAVVGNTYSSATYSYIGQLNSSGQIFYVDFVGDTIEALEFDGTDLVRVGNQYDASGDGGSGMSNADGAFQIAENKIVWVDHAFEDMYVYAFDGTNWTQESSQLNLKNFAGYSAGSKAFGADNEAFLATGAVSGDADLINVSYNGTSTLSQVGNATTITGNYWMPAGISEDRIAVLDTAADTVQAYDWDGTDLTTAGSTYSVAGSAGRLGIERLGENEVIVWNINNLEILSFNGSSWSSRATLDITASSWPRSIARISDTRFAAHYFGGGGNIKVIDVTRGTDPVAAMLTSYPAQPNGETAASGDFDLDNDGNWTFGNQWADGGNGTFTKSATGWSNLERPFTFDVSKEYASVINISTAGSLQGVKGVARPSGDEASGIFPRGESIFASKQPFSSGDTTLRFLGGNTWTGAITQAGLFDITDIDDLPVHIVMVAGQSNAIGFGTDGMDPEKDNWHPRIWCMPGGDWENWAADDATLDLANDPIQFQEVVNNQVSPAMAAARRIVSAHPNHRVVLVPMAKGSTDLIAADAYWNPNTTRTDANQKMFQRLKDRYTAAVAALSGVTIASVSLMWSQGEADTISGNNYEVAFAAFRSQLMTDLSLSELPTVILGRTIPDPASPSDLVAAQQNLDQDSGNAAAISDVVYFDLAGASFANPSPDDVHFTTEAQRIRGDYAGQLLAVRLARTVGSWPSPRVQN